MGKIASSNRLTDSIFNVTDRWFVAVPVGKHPTWPEYLGLEVVPLLCLFRLQAVSSLGVNRQDLRDISSLPDTVVSREQSQGVPAFISHK
jgi:hypothetical protein